MAKQDPSSIRFYEKAWEQRQQKMASIISGGDKDPLSVIHKFARHIVKYNTLSNLEEVEVTYPPGILLFPTGKPAYKTHVFLDKFYPGPTYPDPIEFILDVLDSGKHDAVVELGAGYGRNLIEIYYRGGPRGIPYLAGELTDSGQNAIQMLADLKPEMLLKPFHFDHKQPTFPVDFQPRHPFIFSCHSIEQVFELPATYFKSIANRFENVLCAHFEPFGFQIAQFPGEPTDRQREFITQRNWNVNFIEVFARACNSGEITEVFTAKNIMGGEPDNPTSIAIWKSSPGKRSPEATPGPKT